MSDNTNTSPYPQWGESNHGVTPPLPVPGYPMSDVPPNATGGNVSQVPNEHATYAEATQREFDQITALQRAQARAAELEARLAALESKASAAPAAGVSPSNGGDPVRHHLHLADGRVIANHDGIGTHYSETLPDGSDRITRIEKYYPAEDAVLASLYA